MSEAPELEQAPAGQESANGSGPHLNGSHGRKRGWCMGCFSGQYPLALHDDIDGNQKDLFPEYLVEEIG